MAGMDVPETVSEAVALLERDGYTAEFVLTDGVARCGVCHHEHSVGELIIERVYRFEGDSDPADEAIVIGVRCAECGSRGVVVSAFGPDADPELVHLVRQPRPRMED